MSTRDRSDGWERFETKKSNQLITGVACSGRYCGNVTISYASVYGVEVDLRKAKWRPGYYSEGRGMNRFVAPVGWFIVGYECRGRYCDHGRFKIAPLDPPVATNVKRGRERNGERILR